MSTLRKISNAGLAAVAALALLWNSPAEAASEYTLSRYDRVRLMILEWDLDDLRSPINGEFIVGADGMIAVPLVGRIEGVGQTLESVAGQVALKLKDRLGLQATPVANLEVISYGPIYVIGDVRAPGQVMFQPGLSVLHALALAGGPTLLSQNAIEAERQTIAAQLEFQQLDLQREGLTSRIKRLQAEAAGMAAPAGTGGSSGSEHAPVSSSGDAIFAARQTMIAVSQEAFRSIQELSSEEIMALEKHLGAVRRQQDVVRSQLEVVSNLRDKGLGSFSREAELERSLSDLESKEQDVLARIVRSKQDNERLREQQQHTERNREIEILTDLKETTLQLKDVEARITASHELASRISAPSSMQNLQFVVTRFDQSTNQPSTIEVDRVTELLSGDILEVRSAPHRVEPAELYSSAVAATVGADETASSQ